MNLNLAENGIQLDRQIQQLFQDKALNLQLLETLLQQLYQFQQKGAYFQQIKDFNKAKMAYGLCVDRLGRLVTWLDRQSHPDTKKWKDSLQRVADKCNQEHQKLFQEDPSTLTDSDSTSPLHWQCVPARYQKWITQHLLNPILYPELYHKDYQGILIYGPSGCGKTQVVTGIQSWAKPNRIPVVNLGHNPIKEVGSYLYSYLNEDPTHKAIVIVDHLNSLAPSQTSTLRSVGDSSETEVAGLQESINTWVTLPNLFLVGVANELDKVEPQIVSKLDLRLEMSLPNLEDTMHYFQFEIVRFLLPQFPTRQDLDQVIKDFTKYYQVPILSESQTAQLTQVAHQTTANNYSYSQLQATINSVLNNASLAAQACNVFLPSQVTLDGEVLFDFVSKLSLQEEYYQSMPHKIPFVSLPPRYSKILFCSDPACKGRCNTKCKRALTFQHIDYSPQFLPIEDERVRNIYLLANPRESKVQHVVAHFPIKVTNRHKGDTLASLYQTIIQLAIALQTNSSQSQSRTKLILDYSLTDYSQSQIRHLLDWIPVPKPQRDSSLLPEVPELSKKISLTNHQFIYLDTHQKDSGTFTLRLNQRSSQQVKEYSKGLPYNIKANQLAEVIAYLLTGNTKLPASYPIKASKGGQVIDTDIYVEMNRTSRGYQWHIQFLPHQLSYRQLVEVPLLQAKSNSQHLEVFVSAGIQVPALLGELPSDYSITNESDIDLLQEKYPDTYSEVYREDEETWKYKTISEVGHLQLLSDTYTPRQKWYLTLYHYLLQFQKDQLSMLASSQQQQLEQLITDVQFKIDQLLFITQEFDQGEWNELWNLSDNHPDKAETVDEEEDWEEDHDPRKEPKKESYSLSSSTDEEEGEERIPDEIIGGDVAHSSLTTDPESDSDSDQEGSRKPYEEKEEYVEFDHQEHIVQQHSDFVVPVFLFWELMRVSNIWNYSKMDQFFQYSRQVQEQLFWEEDYTIYLKSRIIPGRAANYYFSRSLYRTQFPTDAQTNHCFLQTLLQKFQKGQSLYFELFHQADAIGIATSDHPSPKWYRFPANRSNNPVSHNVRGWIDTTIDNLKSHSISALWLLTRGLNDPASLQIIDSYLGTALLMSQHPKIPTVQTLLSLLLYPDVIVAQGMEPTGLDTLLNSVISNPILLHRYQALQSHIPDLILPKPAQDVEKLLIEADHLQSHAYHNPTFFGSDAENSWGQSVPEAERYQHAVKKQFGLSSIEIKSLLRVYRIRIEYFQELFTTESGMKVQ